MRWVWVAAAIVAVGCGRAWQRDESERVASVTAYEQPDEEALHGVPEPNVPDATGRFEPSPRMTWQGKGASAGGGKRGKAARAKAKKPGR